MIKLEVGTIIHQTNYDATYEILQINSKNSLVKSSRLDNAVWIPNETIEKYIEESKGYIGKEPVFNSNRIDSIE